MIYTLRHFDTPLLGFSVKENVRDPLVAIEWLNEGKRNLLPLDLTPTPEGISFWIKRRTIPKNRAFVDSLLSKSGLNLNRPFNILTLCMGLSLNDCYWVTQEGFTGTFEQHNLYKNRFSRTLAEIAFTGYGSSIRASLVSSPEYTTNGMLAKCWRRLNGEVFLYKAGTTGASNTGREPYAEYYASQIAKALQFSAVQYTLTRWKGRLCSCCPLFTNLDYSFMPVGRIVTSGGFRAVQDYYENLGGPFTRSLGNMLVFDALVANTDRHYGNFGFLVDSRRNTIVNPAPLFDHGNSLLNMAGNDDFSSEKKLLTYSETLSPVAYNDFFAESKKILTDEHRRGLRSILGFTFVRHPRYNLPADRLALLEKVLHHRAGILLG